MTEKLSDAWQCQSCGCYFPHIPKVLDNDIKRCSKCVEVEVLEEQVEGLETKLTMCEMALRVAHLPLPPYETVLASEEEA